jgi:drug/metabolite transporter (DMT)-like permease
VTYLAFSLVALIWGTTWVAIKYSLVAFPPFSGAMLRFVIAIAVLALFAKFKRVSLSMPRELLRHVVVTALLLYVVDYGLIYWAEQYLTAGVTAIFFASLPLATALVSTLAYKNEVFSYRKLAGIVVGVIGIVVVFLDQMFATEFTTKVWIACAGVVAAALAAAFNVAIAKRHLMSMSAISLTVHQMRWGALGLAVIATLNGEWPQIQYSATALAAMAYLGIVGSAVAFVLYYVLLRTMHASTLATITYLTPLVAVATGWWFLDESISLRAIVGALIIFAGIAIIQFESLMSFARRSQSSQRAVARRIPDAP